MAKIRRMVLLMRLLFEDDPRIAIDAVYQVVEAAYRSVDGEYGAEQARQSGMLDNGLPFSSAAVVGGGDLAQFQACNLDLARMTREEHNLSLKGWLSEERVRNCNILLVFDSALRDEVVCNWLVGGLCESALANYQKGWSLWTQHIEAEGHGSNVHLDKVDREEFIKVVVLFIQGVCLGSKGSMTAMEAAMA
jgi:hypothetical protein